MSIWVEGPRVGPVRFGVLLPYGQAVPYRPAPPARWGVRFAVVFAALLPVWTLGLLTAGEIGPSPAGALWLALLVIAGAVRAGVRLGRYAPPVRADILRWAGTALGALLAGFVLCAFLAAALAA